MFARAMTVWIVGLLTLVPYATYYLLFEAPREQYALLITLVLFWVFGYWGVAGPLVTALTARQILRAVERARSSEELVKALASPESREIAIQLIASENRIPRFVVARLCDWVLARLAAGTPPPGPSPR